MKQLLLILFVSFIQSFLSALFAIVIAFPLAYIFSSYKFKFKFFLFSFFILLFFIPGKLIALCLSESYSLNGLFGIVMCHVILNFPLAFYLFYIRFNELDPNLKFMSIQMGANNYQLLKTIYLPWMNKILISVGFLIFTYCFLSFSVPYILANNDLYNTFEVYIHKFYESHDYTNLIYYAVTQSGILFGLSFFLGKNDFFNFENSFFNTTSQNLSIRNNKIIIFFIGLFILTIMIIMYSLLKQFSEPKTINFLKDIFINNHRINIYSIFFNSILIASLSTILAIIISYIFIEFEIDKNRVIKAIILLPFLLGSIISGMLFGLLNSLFLQSTFLTIILSHIFLHYPLSFKILSTQNESFDEQWRHLSLVFGASRFQMFKTVRFPFLIPSFIASFLILFCLSFCEVGSGSLACKNNDYPTIAVFAHCLRKLGLKNEAMGLNFVIMAISFIIIYGLMRFKRN